MGLFGRKKVEEAPKEVETTEVGVEETVAETSESVDDLMEAALDEAEEVGDSASSTVSSWSDLSADSLQDSLAIGNGVMTVLNRIGDAVDTTSMLKKAEEFSEKHRKVLNSHTIGFISAGGGCGCTTLVSEVVNEVKSAGRKILVLNLDIEGDYLASLLGVTVTNDLASDKPLKDCVVSVGGISYLGFKNRGVDTACRFDDAEFVISFLDTLFDTMETAYDYIFVDLGSRLDVSLPVSGLKYLEDLVIVYDGSPSSALRVESYMADLSYLGLFFGGIYLWRNKVMPGDVLVDTFKFRNELLPKLPYSRIIRNRFAIRAGWATADTITLHEFKEALSKGVDVILHSQTILEAEESIEDASAEVSKTSGADVGNSVDGGVEE